VPTFQNIRGEGLRALLDRDEATLLRHLLDEMKTLLEADLPRADPVTARLFPEAHEDPEEAEAFRTLVGDELRQVKLESLRVVRERIGKRGNVHTSIPEDEVPRWLALLTDLRLAIGTRLDVSEESMARELDPDDPDSAALSVLHWLGWVQESILDALTQEEPQ